MARKFSSRFKEILIDCISNSFNVRMLNKLGERIEPLFNIHKISGISEKMSIQPMLMAKNFVDHFFVKNYELKLINELIKTSYSGIDGYPINVYNLNGLFKELEKLGYFYDKTYEKLIFTDHESVLNDWGYLEQGKDYDFCFISVDIVKNSTIVREDNPRLIKETYKLFHNYISAKINARDGRLWIWEGDGGIIVFQGENAVNRAIYGVLDFYLSLPVFNATYNKIKSVIIPRIAVHFGKAVFKKDVYAIKSEAMDTVRNIEKNFTEPGNIVITNIVHISLNSNLKNFFKPITKDYKHELLKFEFIAGRKPVYE